MNNVLIIDDDAWWGEYCKSLLELHGFKAAHSLTINEAFESLDASSFDAILLDFLLPEANALQVLHELQSYNDTNTLPVILCSSVGELNEHTDSLEKYGVRIVLDKATVTPKRLIKAVEAVIV